MNDLSVIRLARYRGASWTKRILFISVARPRGISLKPLVTVSIEPRLFPPRSAKKRSDAWGRVSSSTPLPPLDDEFGQSDRVHREKSRVP